MHLIKLVDLKESCHIFWSLHHSHIQKYFYNLISYILLEFFNYNISSCFSEYYVCKTGRKIKIRDAQVTKTKMEARMFWPWAANPDLLFNMSRVFLLQQSPHTHTHTHTQRVDGMQPELAFCMNPIPCSGSHDLQGLRPFTRRPTLIKVIHDSATL